MIMNIIVWYVGFEAKYYSKPDISSIWSAKQDQMNRWDISIQHKLRLIQFQPPLVSDMGQARSHL